MNRLTGTLLGCAAFIIPLTAHAAESLPLKRVVITTSGLALYEHQGSVTGDQSVNLPVRLDQVDDVLKSLVVLDSKGQLGAVSLPGREPLSQTFRDLPFTQDDLNDLSSLLNALRGASVKIDSIEGRLMNVSTETEQTKDGGVITRRRVSVSTPSGIKTALIESAAALQFTDKAVQAQLDRALEAMFTNRIKDQRSLSISLLGEGARNVGLAYIEDAPLWKSSYRLVLPAEDAKEPKALLQGWAVLENTTGQDWKDVSVTLTSGSPVTYRQSLYESYYVTRPELPVKFMGPVIPRIDLGTVAEEKSRDENEAYDKDSGARRADAPKLMKSQFAVAEGAMMAMDSVAGSPPMPAMAPMPEAAPMRMASVVSAAADETASQMTFAFPQPVTLTAGDSLMIPFASRDLPAEKLYIYQPETNALHPLAAVAVKNDTESGFPPGILTLYDAEGKGLLHVGDAEMPLIPKGETRFISFALDTKTNIDQKTEDDRRLGMISINKGFLIQKSLWRNTSTYTVKAPTDEGRTIVIEHPRREGWELVKPEGIEGEPETTPTHHRLKVNVEAGKSASVKITLERAEDETIALIGIAPDDLSSRIIAAGKDLPKNVKTALLKVKDMQSVIYGLQQQNGQIEQDRQRIYADQDRLRQNLQTVSSNTDIGKRYLNTMNEQETKLEQLTTQQNDLNAKINAAVQELQNYISTLEF